ncbi:hypothetical protein AA313_de0200752 [Arthrobotrys entomopaga]|nr:hypothetical protein AA313_de0200752 [Arthrobotrys entomopaga]
MFNLRPKQSGVPLCRHQADKVGILTFSFRFWKRSNQEYINVNRKDQTISKLYSSIYRLEKKIEDVASLIRHQNDPTTEYQSKARIGPDISLENGNKGRLSIADVLNNSPEIKKAQMNTVFSSVPPSISTSHFGHEAKQMSFSAHKILQWPAIQVLLPDILQESELVQDYATKLEAARPPLPFDTLAATSTSPGTGAKHDWLQSLPLSVVRGLTEAYFNTFNTSNPILDRGYFYTATLSVAVESGFGYNIESCILLVVLALGCLAVTAHKEAGFPLFPLHSGDTEAEFMVFIPPDWIEITEELDGLPSGLKFLNEQRRRFGFLICGTGLEYVQCHLLVALYYAQAVRVLDHWHMINKAAVGCLVLLNGPNAQLIDWETWESDMLARVFWNTLMFERLAITIVILRNLCPNIFGSILVQELDVPASGLADYEDVVPLPKFPLYSSSSSLGTSTAVEDNESNYQYHFLAQAAHRKLLNRARNNIYTYGVLGRRSLSLQVL